MIFKTTKRLFALSLVACALGSTAMAMDVTPNDQAPTHTPASNIDVNTPSPTPSPTVEVQKPSPAPDTETKKIEPTPAEEKKETPTSTPEIAKKEKEGETKTTTKPRESAKTAESAKIPPMAMGKAVLSGFTEFANIAIRNNGIRNAKQNVTARFLGDFSRLLGDLVTLYEIGYDDAAEYQVNRGQLGRGLLTALDAYRTAYAGFCMATSREIEQREMDKLEQAFYRLLPVARALATCTQEFGSDTDKKNINAFATVDDLKLALTLFEVALEMPRGSTQAKAVCGLAGASLVGFAADAIHTAAAAA